MFSFGQGGFMLMGAYFAAIANMKYNVPFPLAVFIGVIAVMLASLLVGIPTLRLRRDYFALVTFAFGEAIRAIFETFSQLAGGSMGLAGIPRFTTIWIALVVAVICVWFTANFKRSKFGRNSLAIRTDELAAKAMGINVFRHKMLVFIISAAMAGLSGALTAFFINYMEPRLFSWNTGVDHIIIVFFGGITSLTGAVISTFILGILPEALRFAAAWRTVLYAVIIILVIIFRPQGILGNFELNGAAIRKAFGWLHKRFIRQAQALPPQ
jgi:branched-chain amino acid transport system permease protein